MDLPSQQRIDEWFLVTSLPRVRLQLLAVAHYIIYRLVNHLRHAGTQDYDYIKRFSHQLLTEATRDDPRLRSAFRRARQARYMRPG